MPQGNWHILHISYLLIDPLAYWHISILSHWYINFMAIIDIIILAAFGLGAIIGFMKGFVKQLASLLGLIVGLLAAKALYASLAVKLCPTLTLYDSGASTGICLHLAGCSFALLPGGFSADPGNGGRLAGLAQSLVGGWSRGFEVPPADEPADWCHRIYRRRQYAD